VCFYIIFGFAFFLGTFSTTLYPLLFYKILYFVVVFTKTVIHLCGDRSHDLIDFQRSTTTMPELMSLPPELLHEIVQAVSHCVD
jgi:hypothetical protein